MDNRILHLDSDIPSVFFPIGRLSEGGSCEFASELCTAHCPSGGVEEVTEGEKFTYNYFRKHGFKAILKKILVDFSVLTNLPRNAKVIQWFAWGDCTQELTEKISILMLRIRDIGIPKYGFTRNKMLWEMIPKSEILTIGLSIDDLDEARRVSVASGKMTAHPDYDSSYAEMIFDGRIVARCNGWWCKILDTSEKVIIERESNCTTCFKTSKKDSNVNLGGGRGCW